MKAVEIVPLPTSGKTHTVTPRTKTEKQANFEELARKSGVNLSEYPDDTKVE
ncbi:MAG: hypothetical protein HRT47_11550 [Candidatus Caenarcaniphilales bacterium]|nr:hypothetical protein [Candidatus Caenarcaniphilales bacterium]